MISFPLSVIWIARPSANAARVPRAHLSCQRAASLTAGPRDSGSRGRHRASVVAEGVETNSQADFLERVGCDSLQGYLFSPAVPADCFGKWLADQGPDEPGSETLYEPRVLVNA